MDNINGLAAGEPGYDSCDEAIYRAFQDVKLTVKKPKKGKKAPSTISTYITLHESRTDVRELLSRYGREKIKRKMTRLASEGVFTNRSTAMCIFPKLYPITSESSVAPIGGSEAAAGDEVLEVADPDDLTLEPEPIAEAPAARDWPTEIKEGDTPPAGNRPIEVFEEAPAAEEWPLYVDISAEEPPALEEAAPPEDDIAEEVMALLVEEAVTVEEIPTETAVPATQEAVRSEGEWLRPAYDDYLFHSR